MLCAKFGWNWPGGSEEEDENVKSLQTDRQTDRRTDGQTDAGRQVIRKAHLSFQLRWAKNWHVHKTCVQSPKQSTWRYKKYIFKSDQFHELPCDSWCMVHNAWVTPWFMKHGSWYMGYWVVHDAWFMIHELPVGSWYKLPCSSWYKRYLMVHDTWLPVGSWCMSYLWVHDAWVTSWFMMHK